MEEKNKRQIIEAVSTKMLINNKFDNLRIKHCYDFF